MSMQAETYTEMNNRGGEGGRVDGCNVITHAEKSNTIRTFQCIMQIVNSKVMRMVTNSQHILHNSLYCIDINEPRFK